MEFMEFMELMELSIELLMEEPEKKRIKLYKKKKKRKRIKPLEVNIYEKNYEDQLDSTDVCLPYDVLRIVFQHFNGRDLSSVAMVCRSWLEAANAEKCLRGPYCFKNFDEDYMQIFDNDSYVEDRQDQILYYIKKSPIKPSIGIFFKVLEPNSECDIKDEIYEFLPKSCEAIMLFAYKNDNTDHLELCDHVKLAYMINIICAFLPQIPNVKISTVEMINGTLKKDVTKRYMQMIKGASQRNHETCLMLFCDDNGYDMGSHMVSLAHDDKRIASMWGGMVEKMQYAHHNNQRRSNAISNGVALLISGSIQTWSVVVNREYETEEQIKRKLKLFKKQVKLQKHSVGLMFSRKKYLMDYVTSLFQSLFPEVRLASFYGRIMFGKDTTIDKPNFYMQCSEKKIEYVSGKHNNKIISRWDDNIVSTSIMILTYG